MITFVNSSNADSYTLLYSKVTELLRTHTDEGYTREEAEALGKEYVPVLTFEKIDLTKDQFMGFEDDLYSDAEGTQKVDKTTVDTLYKNTDLLSFYQPETINSLSEFFGHLADISKVEPRYTRLPLDEDFFSVDLDTRKITVPSSLASIAVQGDEMSEIVYFKVKRYYDAADLYGTKEVTTETGNYRQNPMDIYIQWERDASDEEKAEAKAAGKTITTVQGVSMPYIIDAESAPGYIIFGWPLSTSITKVSGTVKFSVRFYVYNDGQITYSLSTLTNSIKINAGLDYDIEYIKEDNKSDSTFIVDNKTQAIIDRYVNSVVNNSEAEVAVPQFLIGITHEGDTSMDYLCTDENNNALTIAKYYKVNDDDEDHPDWKSTNLAINNNTGYLSEPIVMYVEARTGGDGSLGYYWKKSTLEGVAEKFNVTPTTVMRETTDTSRDSAKTYYYYEENKTNTGAIIIPDDETFTTKEGHTVLASDGTTLVYERFGKAILDSIGCYYAVATNRVHNNVASTRTPANTKDANLTTVYNYLRIPGPKTPSYATKIANRLYLDLTDTTKQTVNDTYKGTLTAKAAPTGDAGKVTYTWEYKAAGSDEFVPLKVTADKLRYDGEEDTGIYNIVGNASYQIVDAEGNGLVTGPKMDASGYANGDGIYRVTIKNHLNRHSAEERDEDKLHMSEVVKETVLDEATGETVETGNWVNGERPAICVASDADCVCECRVTHVPAEPHVVRANDLPQRLSLTQAQADGLKVEIVKDETSGKPLHEVENGEFRTDEDKYIYKWYRYVTWTGHVTEEDTKTAENHEYKVDDDKLVKIYDDITSEEITNLGTVVKMSDAANVVKALAIDDGDTFVPERAGIYFCQVINVYNGRTDIYQCSPFFVVSDTTGGATSDASTTGE